MNIQDYWSKSPSEQDKTLQQSKPKPYMGRCGGIVEVTEPRKEPTNPCIAVHGACSIVDQTCRGCIHLRYAVHYQAKHWKCDLRKLTHGAATDHRVSWPACAKYEKRTEEYHGG